MTEIVPYTTGSKSNTRKAYVREKDLANGAHIKLVRFIEPGSEGDCGVNLEYLSPEKDGRRTLLKFALSDEAALQTCLMLREFFGVGVCA